MKEIIIGTTNPAKIKQLRGALDGVAVVLGVPDGVKLPDVVEDGKTAQENAKKKASECAAYLGKRVLSMDNALYFDALVGDPKQPGINVRRIPGGGERPTDQEMLEYYSELIKSIGQDVDGHWEFAVCVATPSGSIFETTIISPRKFVSTPSKETVEGYPLEGLQIDPVTGKYISEMDEKEQAEFWQRNIGEPLRKFVESLEI